MDSKWKHNLRTKFITNHYPIIIGWWFAVIDIHKVRNISVTYRVMLLIVQIHLADAP